MLFEALLAALDVVDRDHANLYADVVLAALPLAARDYLEGCMSTTAHRYQSDFARRYFDAGEAKGEARAVLAVLSARGIEVPGDVRERTEACGDLELVETWIRRAVTARTVNDIFEDGPTP